MQVTKKNLYLLDIKKMALFVFIVFNGLQTFAQKDGSTKINLVAKSANVADAFTEIKNKLATSYIFIEDSEIIDGTIYSITKIFWEQCSGNLIECKLMLLIKSESQSKVTVTLSGKLVRQGQATFNYEQPMMYKKKKSCSSTMFKLVNNIFINYEKSYS